MKKLIAILPLVVIVIAFSCSDDSDSDAPKTMLVTVVESDNLISGTEVDIIFFLYKDKILKIFADMFEVEKKELEGKSINDIFDDVGEEWQIRKIGEYADVKYDDYLSLTDDKATSEIFIDTLNTFRNRNYTFDLVFSLKGEGSCVRFKDQCRPVNEIVGNLRNMGLNIRTLYQTCPYGSEMIDNWESIDIKAVNGSQKDNKFVIFSPVYFAEDWLVNGMTFEDAVQSAYYREMDSLKTYDSIMPLSEYMLTDRNINDGIQSVGGTNPALMWDDFEQE
jgi:hypothetical protein